MAGFRVENHQTWRGATPLTAPAQGSTAGPQTPAPSVADLQRQVTALGPIAYPARAYDKILGPLQARSGLFWAMRFLLVATTVMLLIGGVQGESMVDHEVGPYRTAMDGGTLTERLSTNAPARYNIDVALGRAEQIVAVFGVQAGTVRVPTVDDDGTHAYGFQFRIVRHDPYMQPILSIRDPATETITALLPTSDDGVSVRYDIFRLDRTGAYQLLLKSGRGSGTADIHVGLAEAPILPVEQVSLDWLPLVGGLAMGTVLVGAYTPGAATLAEIRDARGTRYRMAEDRMMPTHPGRLVRGDGVRSMHGTVAPAQVTAAWIRRD